MFRSPPLRAVAAVTVWLFAMDEVGIFRLRVRVGRIFQIKRDLGVTDLLTQFFGDVGTVVFAVLTQLGDVWFLFVLAGGFYLGSTRPGNPLARRRGAFILALPIVYVVTVQALKGVFTLPRPRMQAS